MTLFLSTVVAHPGSGPALPQPSAGMDAPLPSVLTAAESSVSSQEDAPTSLSDGADHSGL